MRTLTELRSERKDITAQLEVILDAADAEKRGLTDEETQKYDEMEKRLDEIKSEIATIESAEARRAKLMAEKAELEQTATPAEERRMPKVTVHDNELDKEFRNFGDFVGAVYGHMRGDIDKRVHQMKNGTSGGFLIPERFVNDILAVDAEQAVVASRSRVVGVAGAPDSEIRIPKLNQKTNDYGGVVAYHQGESDTLTESTASFEQITLKPHKITVYTTASNEVLQNAAGFSSFLQALMRDSVIDVTETDYISGDGVNKALGFLNAPGRIDITRATASSIGFADIVGMMARRLLRGGGNWIWLASQSVLPQLAQATDGTNNIYVTNMAAGMPPSLMGLPIIYNDRMPLLGTRGDLCLVDLSKYLIANGSGPSLMLSEHARFANDETAMRLTFRTDGQLWLDAPIAPKGSTTDTRSPIIVLN